MSHNKIVSQKITGKITVSIISADPSTNLGQPLWAINWFDLKRGWLYELYNRLAFSHVKRIGAYPIFKGKLSKALIDNERLRRDMLLIVKYPQAQSFLEMISSTLFQIKSLLRTSAVKYFQFGFMQMINQVEPKILSLKYEGQLKYLVHVCENGSSVDIQPLIDFAATKEVFPHFIGQRSAILGTQNGSGKLKTLDFMLSHVIVLSGFDTEALEELIQTQYYQKFIQSFKSNFIGLYDRKI